MSQGDEHPVGGPTDARDSPKDPVPAVPTTAGEDDPRAWGDTPDDHDAWLREQRPPHWG